MIMARPRRELWRLALEVSLTCLIGGALFVLVGSLVAAWATFGAGLVCAAAAGGLFEHDRRGKR
jgi:1,4-dihydroxy-2-naphthoate octaprenyltransferase